MPYVSRSHAVGGGETYSFSMSTRVEGGMVILQLGKALESCLRWRKWRWSRKRRRRYKTAKPDSMR
jgi:hypothetical protein